MNIIYETHGLFLKNGVGTYTRAMAKALRNSVNDEDEYIIFFPYQVSGYESYGLSNVYYSSNKQPGNIEKIYNGIHLRPTTFNKKTVKELIELINKKKIDYVIISQSFSGGLAKIIKRNTNAKTITVFQDIIDESLRQRIKYENKLQFFKNLPRLLIGVFNEHSAVKHSDKCVVFSEREKQVFIKHYKRTPEAIVPTFVEDNFNMSKVKNCSDKIVLLFVGAYYWPNIDGVRWFIKSVLPYLDDRYIFYIVGLNMEKLKKDFEELDKKVKVIGTVDELDTWYYDADIVISPIFKGTGMKTKTIEAFMYGKYILGAPEAMAGIYNSKEYTCKDADEFINKILNYNRKLIKYDEKSRKNYLENYSPIAIANKFKELFD